MSHTEPCAVFMNGGVVRTELCVYACSTCGNVMHVDGNEELLLIKGTWKSLAFFTAGAFANQLLQTNALAVGGVDVSVARSHLRRSLPSNTLTKTAVTACLAVSIGALVCELVTQR